MASILAQASKPWTFEEVLSSIAQHCPGASVDPSDSIPPWSDGPQPRCRRLRVPIANGNELIGTFARNGDLVFSVRPPIHESLLTPLLAALNELEYIAVQVLGVDGYNAESAAAPDRGGK